MRREETRNIINISILQAMNALPQDQLVSVFKDSAVFRAVALYVWTVLEPAKLGLNVKIPPHADRKLAARMVGSSQVLH